MFRSYRGVVMKADVLVVGAGPAGSAAAYFLAKRGVDVLLADQHQFPREKACGDGLTPRAVHLLAEMDVLPCLEAASPWRVRGVRLWAPSGHGATVRFEPPPKGEMGYGLVVRRRDLDEQIRQRAVEAGVRFLGGFKAVGAVRDWRQIVGVRAVVESSTVQVDANLTIVATGANTSFLRSMGFTRPGLPAAVAIRGYFEGVRGLDDHLDMYLDAGPPVGYAWIFPVADGVANVGAGIYVGDRESYRVDLRGLLSKFVSSDGRASRKLVAAKQMGQPRGGLLRLSFPLLPTWGYGVLLTGEAAGLVDPLMGEGIGNALESGQIAGEFAAEALAAGDMSAQALAGYHDLLCQRFEATFRSARKFRQRFGRAVPLEILMLLIRMGYSPGFLAYG
jgi:geranylgeranyl reductase family protein